MKPLTMAIGLICALTVTGCASTGTSAKFAYTGIPGAMLQDCTVTPPPAIDTYVKSDTQQREGQMTDAYVDQTNNLANCNRDKKSLREWDRQQRELYESSKK